MMYPRPSRTSSSSAMQAARQIQRRSLYFGQDNQRQSEARTFGRARAIFARVPALHATTPTYPDTQSSSTSIDRYQLW
ncbi:hypothetical protein FA95DRAFT_1394148 [Auriscalpium vulgare]|uniref:Uncharacterized protein n=1 Tax=Auriscalpium vulgare TaxID=40419 RepID=A0ACB8RRJ1_9AGAM|nr:hypothetical protein FA95DRAFT_1394148 [Auriscalpium vulgare]